MRGHWGAQYSYIATAFYFNVPSLVLQSSYKSVCDLQHTKPSGPPSETVGTGMLQPACESVTLRPASRAKPRSRCGLASLFGAPGPKALALLSPTDFPPSTVTSQAAGQHLWHHLHLKLPRWPPASRRFPQTGERSSSCKSDDISPSLKPFFDFCYGPNIRVPLQFLC